MKILQVALAAMLLFTYGTAHAETNEASLLDGTRPAGLEESVARELKSGKRTSAVIPDKIGIVGRELSFTFPWLTRDVRHFDHVVTYRNDTWITQPLPVWHEQVPDRFQTFAMAAFGLVSILLLVVGVLCATSAGRRYRKNTYVEG